METPEPGMASPSLPVLWELSLLHREWLGLRNLLLLFWLGNTYHLLISCLLQASGHCWSLSGRARREGLGPGTAAAAGSTKELLGVSTELQQNSRTSSLGVCGNDTHGCVGMTHVPEAGIQALGTALSPQHYPNPIRTIPSS